LRIDTKDYPRDGATRPNETPSWTLPRQRCLKTLQTIIQTTSWAIAITGGRSQIWKHFADAEHSLQSFELDERRLVVVLTPPICRSRRTCNTSGSAAAPKKFQSLWEQRWRNTSPI